MRSREGLEAKMLLQFQQVFTTCFFALCVNVPRTSRYLELSGGHPKNRWIWNFAECDQPTGKT